MYRKQRHFTIKKAYKPHIRHLVTEAFKQLVLLLYSFIDGKDVMEACKYHRQKSQLHHQTHVQQHHFLYLLYLFYDLLYEEENHIHKKREVHQGKHFWQVLDKRAGLKSFAVSVIFL
jgi:hypothetical protein